MVIELDGCLILWVLEIKIMELDGCCHHGNFVRWASTYCGNLVMAASIAYALLHQSLV